MKKFIQSSIIAIIVIVFIFFLAHYSNAQTWQRVGDVGFGNPRNDYAWCMTTFKGNLYVGTLNLMGRAEIWRSQNGEPNTWEQVYNARLMGNFGIRCLYADGDKALYAGTLNQRGAQILRSTNGYSWQIIAKRGIGNRKNRNIRCITRFGEYLYAGVGSDGANLFRSKEGIQWDLVETIPDIKSTMVFNPSGDTPIMNNLMIGELTVFKGQLYAFTWTKDVDFRSMKNLDRNKNEQKPPEANLPPAPGAFEVWRSSDGINWGKVVGQDDEYRNGMGFSLHDPENLDNDVVTSVAVFEGNLYLGTGHDYGKTSIWRTNDGTKWEKVLDFFELGEKFNFYIWRMQPFHNKLFIGTLNLGDAANPGVTGAQIWFSETGTLDSFYPLILNGFDGETVFFTKNLDLPKNCGIRSMTVFNDALFVGTATVLSVPVSRRGERFGLYIVGKNAGCEIWKMIP